MDRTTVVVMGRNYTSLLGMARAVGVAGCEVYLVKTAKKVPGVFSPRRLSSETKSKYVKKTFYSVEPNREALVNLLLKQFSKNGNVILLPVDDYTASTVDMYQDKLKPYFLFPHVKNGSITQLMDKGFQKKMAKKAGLCVAEGWIAEVSNGQFSLPEGITYPCFTKPQISFLGNKVFMKRCDSEADLTKLLSDVALQRNCPILIEEFIEIEKEYGIVGFSNGTDIIMPALTDKIVIGNGKHKGVTVVGQLFPMERYSRLKEQLQTLMRQTHFVGVFDIDLYENGGRIYFNELNLRMGAFGYAIMCAGINLPKMLIDTLLGNPTVEQNITLKREIKCLSDKVNLEDFSDGYIDWKEYKKRVQTADFRFLPNSDDPRPYRYFKIRLWEYYIKRKLFERRSKFTDEGTDT